VKNTLSPPSSIGGSSSLVDTPASPFDEFFEISKDRVFFLLVEKTKSFATSLPLTSLAAFPHLQVAGANATKCLCYSVCFLARKISFFPFCQIFLYLLLLQLPHQMAPNFFFF